MDTVPPQLDQMAEFEALQLHLKQIAPIKMREQFTADPERFQNFSLSAANLNLDYSKNRITKTTIDLLVKLAQARQLPKAVQSMFNGEHINRSEDRVKPCTPHYEIFLTNLF